MRDMRDMGNKKSERYNKSERCQQFNKFEWLEMFKGFVGFQGYIETGGFGGHLKNTLMMFVGVRTKDLMKRVCWSIFFTPKNMKIFTNQHGTSENFP